jgi:hypothetical protein
MHRCSAKGRNPESQRQVGPRVQAIYLFVDDPFIDEEAACADLGVGLLETILQVAIGQVAVGLVIVEALVGQIESSPSVEMGGKVAIPQLVQIDAEKLGGRRELLLLKAGTIVLGEAEKGGRADRGLCQCCGRKGQEKRG